MKWMFTLTACLALESAFAQFDTEVYEKFCEVRIGTQTLAGYWEVYADSGQARNGWGNRQLLMRDRNGIIRFRSKMDALNYLGERGWTLVATYPIIEPSSVQNLSDKSTVYLFRKIAVKDALYYREREIREGGR